MAAAMTKTQLATRTALSCHEEAWTEAKALARVDRMDERRTRLGVGVTDPEGPTQPASPGPPPPGASAGQAPQRMVPALALEAVTPRTSARLETLSRHFLGISLRRAFRLQIRTDEVLPSERALLESQARHITDPDHQAFLAWRRSVLLLVAMMFVPP